MESLRSLAQPTPLGTFVVVVGERGVVATTFVDDDPEIELDRLERRLGAAIRIGGRGLAPVGREVEAYFAGRGRVLRTPIDLTLAGDGFGRRVLEVTMRISFGELATYGDVAAAAGAPRGGRAAGNALGRCPIELYVPCHRVVHAGGTIGGYGRHEDRKRWLLHHEGAV
jgi:methylated-DNA-[protein]-cysteine S-methyltransferase